VTVTITAEVAAATESPTPRMETALVPSISPVVADPVVIEREERSFEVPVRLSLVPSVA
jgi:hypothetical protein